MRDGMDSSAPSHVSGPAPDTAHWPSLLEELDVTFLMLDIDHDAELLALFQAHSEWVIDSRDEQVVLLARSDACPNPAGSRGEREPGTENLGVLK
jgi:hypothetical protein